MSEKCEYGDFTVAEPGFNPLISHFGSTKYTVSRLALHELFAFNRPSKAHTGFALCPNKRWCGCFDRGCLCLRPRLEDGEEVGSIPLSQISHDPRHVSVQLLWFECCPYGQEGVRSWQTRTCYCHSSIQLMIGGHAADDLDNAALGSHALKCSVAPLATMNGIHKARFALCHHLAGWVRRYLTLCSMCSNVI